MNERDIRPKTAEAYIELVRQALYEVEELRLSVEYDMEFMGKAMEFLVPLEAELRALYERMRDGSYLFKDEDLPFMRLVEAQDERLLPFKQLFRVINATHRKGLNVEEDQA